MKHILMFFSTVIKLRTADAFHSATMAAFLHGAILRGTIMPLFQQEISILHNDLFVLSLFSCALPHLI